MEAVVGRKQEKKEWPVTQIEDIGELICLVPGDVIVINGNRRTVGQNDDTAERLVVVSGCDDYKRPLVFETTFHYEAIKLDKLKKGSLRGMPSYFFYCKMHGEMAHELIKRGCLM